MVLAAETQGVGTELWNPGVGCFRVWPAFQVNQSRSGFTTHTIDISIFFHREHDAKSSFYRGIQFCDKPQFHHLNFCWSIPCLKIPSIRVDWDKSHGVFLGLRTPWREFCWNKPM